MAFKKVRRKFVASLAVAASPIAALYLYRYWRRRKATERLLDALQKDSHEVIEAACEHAEEVGCLDESLIIEGRNTAKRLYVRKELQEVTSQDDVYKILKTCKIATEFGVEDTAILAAKTQVQELVHRDLQSDDATRILKACALSEEAGVDKAMAKAGRLKAMRIAEAGVEEALRTGNPAKISKACLRAEAVGVKKDVVLRGRSEAQRLQAEQQLLESLQSDDVKQIEMCLRRACEASVSQEVIAQGQMEARKARAKALLQDAMHRKKAAHVQSALAHAQSVGIDDALIGKAAANLTALLEQEKSDKKEAESCIQQARELGQYTELYNACRRAEKAGVEDDFITKNRLEARRLYDAAELHVALQEDDIKRAFVASGGTLGTGPLEY